MKREELLPYLNKFLTVTLEDGSERSGYAANYAEIRDSAGEDVRLQLTNGLYTEAVPLSRIRQVRAAVREDTVQLPVVDWKDGYRDGRK